MANLWETPLWQAAVIDPLNQAEAVRVAAKKSMVSQRTYASGRPSRLTTGFSTSSSSANSELATSLAVLRDRSRQLIRDSAYAKRAKLIVVNNLIGSGIGFQSEVRGTRGELRASVNDAIEAAWEDWARPDNCHTGGALHFSDLERQLIGQVFETGEAFIRLHYQPFGLSQVPLGLEIIESERLAEDYAQPSTPVPGNRVWLGVEFDKFYRPQAYWIRTRHPGETRSIFVDGGDHIERVPASEIIHLRLVDRWPQLRGEPWMHAVIRKLADIDGYTEAEIVAARAASMYFGTIESNEDTASFGEEQEDGTYQLPLEPGMVEKLRPGEKLNFVNPNRPNSALDPFLRYMLREMAAGVGCSYESLSRDYSQSNYSSSRLALLDDRDSWRALQRWFIRTFRERLHRVWLQQAALSGAVQGVRVDEFAINADKFGAVSFKPRGWSWVDPTKEVEAYKEAVKAGFTTVADVIAESGGGRDIQEVLEQRRRELDEMDELDLEFDTSPQNYEQKDPAPAAAPEPAPAEPADPKERQMTPINVAVTLPPITIANHVPPSQVHVKAPIEWHSTHHTDGAVVNVQAPTVENRIELPETVVNVAAPSVHVDPPSVTVESAIVNVENRVDVPAPVVNVENRAPEIRPEVTVNNNLPTYEVTEQKVVRDSKGRVDKTVTKRTRAG